MDEQSRRHFLTRYATLALSGLAAAIDGGAKAAEVGDGTAVAGKVLLSQQEPPVAVYGPPPAPTPWPQPPAPVYGPPPRTDGPRLPPKALYGPPPRGPGRLIVPTPTPDGAG